MLETVNETLKKNALDELHDVKQLGQKRWTRTFGNR